MPHSIPFHSVQLNIESKTLKNLTEFNNGGRWSDLEHSLFLEGIAKFGKDWRRIARIVGTRTTVQTRSHAQKHFEKIGKEMQALESMASGDLPISNIMKTGANNLFSFSPLCANDVMREIFHASPRQYGQKNLSKKRLHKKLANSNSQKNGEKRSKQCRRQIEKDIVNTLLQEDSDISQPTATPLTHSIGLCMSKQNCPSVI